MNTETIQAQDNALCRFGLIGFAVLVLCDAVVSLFERDAA